MFFFKEILMPSTQVSRQAMRQFLSKCFNSVRMKQPEWLLPTLMTLVFVIAFLGVAACKPPHH